MMTLGERLRRSATAWNVGWIHFTMHELPKVHGLGCKVPTRSPVLHFLSPKRHAFLHKIPTRMDVNRTEAVRGLTARR
jgi:hypothetical protein